MPGSAATRSIWALGIAVVVVSIVVAGLPLVASTQIVRDSIARQMSAWSGYRVKLGAAPNIQVWPSFRAVLNDVTLSGWSSDAPAAIEADRVEIDLSALAALRGDVVFTKIRLVRPTIRVESRRGPLLFPAASSGGRLERAVKKARDILEANPSKPDVSALPTDALATIEVQDGRVVRPDGGTDREIVTSLVATLDWSALNRSANLSASAIWHGEAVSIDASSTQPLLLLAGGMAPTTLTLRSVPLNIAFDGAASMADGSFVDGQLKLSSPSLKRMLEWAGADVAPGKTIGKVDIACHLSGNAQRLKFENAQIKLDDNPGKGVFDVSFGNAPVGISGTLDFKSLDLQSFVSAFAQLPAEPDAAESTLETAVASQFNVDLRVSAASAAVGPISLADVAATAQVKGRLAAFDISDAKAFDGNVQFGLRVDRKAKGNLVEVRMTADDIDGSKVASALGWRFMPQARGSLSVILKGVGENWREVLETANGSTTASFGKGVMPGIDLAAFLARSAKGGFFPLSDIREGVLAFDSAEMKATVTEGVARIDKAEARSEKAWISLGGLVPFVGRGLALSGFIAPPAPVEEGQTAPEGPHRAFFVGGSWSSPFISPVLPGLPRLPPG